MAEKTDPISDPDFNNYIKLQYILRNINKTLGHLFVKEWNSTRTKWEDSDLNRKEFIDGPGKDLYQSCQRIQKEYMLSRNVSTWDMPLLIQAIKSLNANVLDEICEELLTLRNEISDLELEISSEEFDKYWNKIKTLLLKLDFPKEQIDEIQLTSIEIVNESEELDLKFKELKNSGNEAFKNDKFEEAIGFYTEAICQSGIPCNELAVLYSNR